MIRKFLCSTLFALGMATMFSSAQALDRPLTDEERQMIQEINTHNSAIDTMAGRFLQIDTNGGRVEGTFFIDRPDRVRFRYAPPSREEIVSEGRGFYVIDRREETKYAYPQESIPLRQFLGQTIDLFSANIVDVVTSEDFMSVTISDDTPIGVVEVSLIFDIATKDIKQWTLTEPSGAELTFSLYDVVYNQEIPDSFFSIPATYRSKTGSNRD